MSKEEADKTFLTTLVVSTLLIIFGSFLLFKPDSTITLISRCITAITAAVGVFGLFKYFTRKNKERIFNLNIIYSIVAFIVSIVVFLYPTAISGVVPLMVGLYMIINCILRVGFLRHLSSIKNEDFGVCLLIFIFMILLGIILIFNPLKNVLQTNQSLGMILVFYATLDIIICYLFKNNIE